MLEFLSKVNWETAVAIATFISIVGSILAGGYVLAVKAFFNSQKNAMELQFTSLRDHIDTQIGTVNDDVKALRSENTRLVSDLAEFKRYVAENYVNRQEWIRFSTSLTASVDRCTEAVEQLPRKLHNVD